MEQEAKLILLRQDMVRTQLRSRGIHDVRVLEAFGQVPRELFVLPGIQDQAYADRPLPIGLGQTISQPYVVALMIQELSVQADHRVLEVGVGSGYQAAVLSRLARRVYAVERLSELADSAGKILAGIGATNVTIAVRDGSLGWPEEAPFERIICGAAAPHIPQAWMDQLGDGGRIIAPLGGPEEQTLVVVEKTPRGLRRREVCNVRFVKLIGQDGWSG